VGSGWIVGIAVVSGLGSPAEAVGDASDARGLVVEEAEGDGPTHPRQMLAMTAVRTAMGKRDMADIITHRTGLGRRV
jgi:hypothetical protein